MSWIEQLAPRHVQQLTPYQSARRIGGSGNVWINANEAPSAPLFLGEESRANRYPEPQPAKVVQQYAEYCRVGSGQITVCRGWSVFPAYNPFREREIIFSPISVKAKPSSRSYGMRGL